MKTAKSLTTLLCSACAVALMADVQSAEARYYPRDHRAASPDEAFELLDQYGQYLSGDFHNHTTCTDGSMSVQTTVNESLVTFGLDWFSQTGHGGSGSRDCRFDDGVDGENVRANIGGLDSYNGVVGWVDTIGQEGIKGDANGSNMWRWQSLIEYAYPLQAQMGELAKKPAWLGLEHNAPGHEHVSMSVLEDQFDWQPSAYSLGQFEYLFDRGDSDSSGGEEYKFEDPANNGIAKTFGDSTGFDGREKAVQSVLWLKENFGTDAYYVPAHVERQGGFVGTQNRGWNVEDFRMLHNAGRILNKENVIDDISIAFGAEMMAGHSFANGGRGTYEADRPSAGFGTYGGAGAYAGAIIAQPGHNFDGSELTDADLEAKRDEMAALFDNQFTEPSGSDAYDALTTSRPKERYVFGKPGIQTMWDALLGEGRKFFLFNSSDWHNRGAFGPFEPQSTLDPWPGEYNKTYVYGLGDDFAEYGDESDARAIVKGMMRGNVWVVNGDLIDGFYFVICQNGRCMPMGSNLVMNKRKGPITVKVMLRDPEGKNNSPYAFNNPSLLPLGLEVPMNQPELSHIDIIRGDITGEIDPSDPAFSENVSNPSTHVFARIAKEDMTVEEDGFLSYEFEVTPQELLESTEAGGVYFRVRGTNMPVGTPNETDADGNPVLDDHALFITCPFENPNPGSFDPNYCPEHLPVSNVDGTKRLDADVEAWADLWFYSNPVFIDFRR